MQFRCSECANLFLFIFCYVAAKPSKVATPKPVKAAATPKATKAAATPKVTKAAASPKVGKVTSKFT